MTNFELSNFERRYFGLKEVKGFWDRIQLSASVIVYFEQDVIVKVLNYEYGYEEYDTDINTVRREILVPRTFKGTQKKLTVPRLLKIKGSGIAFTGSFHGGGINVYNRNVSFIRSYLEEGIIASYIDISKWVQKFIAESPENYFDWLTRQLESKKQKIRIKKGDIIAFNVSRFEFAFASIINSYYLSEHELLNGEILRSNLFGEPILILPYAKISNSTKIDFEKLLESPTLPPIEIFHYDISNGRYPVVGNRNLPVEIMTRIDLSALNKYLTIPLSRTNIITRSHQF